MIHLLQNLTRVILDQFIVFGIILMVRYAAVLQRMVLCDCGNILLEKLMDFGRTLKKIPVLLHNNYYSLMLVM